MATIWEKIESPTEDAQSLRRRNRNLAAIHIVQGTAAVAVLALVVWRMRELITLTQRSNVESLVLGFVVVFLVYILLTSWRAIVGSFQLFAYRLMGERRAQPALQRKVRSDPKITQRSLLNIVVRGPGDDPIEVPLEDKYGKLGTMQIALNQISLQNVPKELTSSVNQIVAKTLKDVGELEGTDRDPKIVYWDSINEEQAEQYLAQVQAFERLEQALGPKKPLWPSTRVDKEGVEELRRQIRAATPYIREALVLPDIEYQAEFAVPVIPEPFAFFQLKRRKEHADPVASMGCAAMVTVFFLIVIAWVVINPPWVPGK